MSFQSFSGSTRIEVITVLSRTTSLKESLDEALRTLITYIESKRKRGKRSAEEVGRKLEELEARFAPHGLAYVFHRARLLSGLNASSVPAVRDAAAQRLNSLVASPASSTSSRTALPSMSPPTTVSMSLSMDSVTSNPYQNPAFCLRRPSSPTHTYASSSFAGGDGQLSRSSSDGWVFEEPSFEATGVQSRGEEEKSRGRSSLSGNKTGGVESRSGRTPAVGREHETRRLIEDEIRALQLDLELLESRSSNSTPLTDTTSPITPARPRSKSNASSTRRPRRSQPPPLDPPPLPPLRMESLSSCSSSIFSTPDSTACSMSPCTVASPSSNSSPSLCLPRTGSLASSSSPKIISPNRRIPSQPLVLSSNVLGLGIQLDGASKSARRRGFVAAPASSSSEKPLVGAYLRRISSTSDRPPSYQTALVDVGRVRKDEEGSQRRREVVRPDTSPTLGWDTLA